MTLYTRWMKPLSLVIAISALSLSSISISYAESAPVYDADALPTDDNYASPEYSPAEDNYETNPRPSNNTTATNGLAPVTRDAYTAEPLTPEQRLKRIEQQVRNMQTGDSSARIESLQAQLQTLQGTVDQLNHQLQLLQAQQKDLYNDLDKRLTQSAKVAGNNANSKLAMPKASGTAVKAPANKPADLARQQPNNVEEQKIYQTAFTLIKAKKYNEAASVLQGMLHKYPSGQFAANAHYWLGELYGLMGKNDLALIQFNTVVKSFPDSPRISDSAFKVGLIYAAQNKWSDAKTTFKKVVSQYPRTASARLASQQLKQLKQAGH